MLFLAVRGLTLLILLLSTLTFTGVTDTAVALAGLETKAACCGQGQPENDRDEGSCPAAECSCLSCLSLIQPQLLQLRQALAEIPPGFGSPPSGQRSDFVPTIDYPPEPV